MKANDAISEYRFSGFRLDARQRKLFNPEGEPAVLSSRAFDTLLVLVENRGETLSKSQIMQTVWPNAVVEENNLNQAISSLRKALGDSKSENNFILTVPGRGYCFVAPVEASVPPLPGASAATALPESAAELATPFVMPAVVPSPTAKVPLLPVAALLVLLIAGAAWSLLRDASSAVATTAGSAAVEPVPEAVAADVIRNSIAVLPFTNLNPDADNELFAVGLHDEVINQLTKVRSLKVIARDSVLTLVDQQLPMADIGRKLRVETMMSGTLMFVDEQARISLQMLDASTGVSLWAETYEANKQDLAEMISIQSDIALHVASALKAEVEQSEKEIIAAMPTKSFEAYRYNLAAKNAHFQQDFAKEFELARHATQLDPAYFDALYTFTTVNSILVATPLPGMSSREHFELTLEGAERMIEIAPARSEGYALKAVALGTVSDWAGVAALADKLAEMEVPIADLKYISLLLMCLGDFERSIEIYEANLVTEPVNLYGRGFLMAALELAGKREQARAEYAIGEELSPVWWGDTTNLFLALGRNEPLQDVEEVVGLSPELKHLLLNLHDSEQVQRGLQAFRDSEHKVSAEAVYYAAIAAVSGDNEGSVEMMRIALVDVWTSMFWFYLPVFDATRKTESFRQLLRDSGIVEYWRQHGWPEVCQPQGDSFTCDWSAYPESGPGA